MIGGKTAKPGMFPFMAALTWSASGTQSHCSGFVVSATAILAAAHCLHVSDDDTLLEANYTANLGDLDREKGTVVQLRVFMHPKYNKQTQLNDISVLKPLRGGQLPIGDYVQPIALEGQLVKAKLAIAMGWGKTSRETCIADGGETSRMLLYHRQRIRRLGKKKINVKGKKSSTCMGDSGSPLVIKRNGEYIAMAILSAGTRFGHEYYTRILPQKKFIQKYAPDARFV